MNDFRVLDDPNEVEPEPLERDRPVTFHDVTAVRETAAAVLVSSAKRFPNVPAAGEPSSSSGRGPVQQRDPNTRRWTLWVPKKCIHDDSEVYGNRHAGKLIVFGWWLAGATKKEDDPKPSWMSKKPPIGNPVPVPPGLQYLPKKPPGRR